ncbi:DUF1971 domain-containing protein [Qipengyuania sp. ASV99]|uniref:DUF1971 domain-containing protein n=1 Tax=Qipengyuania sp. ASV99 TaxID=3399681 RepID=UPI003A4C5EA8
MNADPRFSLTPGASCYRRLGPYDEGSIPRGLLAEHRLKAAVWATLTVEAGTIMFVWDDKECDRCKLVAGDEFVVPSREQHRLELVGPVRLSIAFHRV